jgi:uncharacterized FlaG/YvyC family protein
MWKKTPTSRQNMALATQARFLMDVPPIGATSQNTASTSGQSDTVRNTNWLNALTAARKLNSLDIVGREYAVVRDPSSQRFIVVVRDEETGAVLDQFPPEDILKMLTQLASVVPGRTGGQTE